jgi:hypothetical protein
MTFLLETDLTARRLIASGENATRSRSTPKDSGSGADFARSLAGADNDVPESDAPKPPAAASSEVTRAASLLIEQPNPDAVAVPTDIPPTDTPIDIKSEIVLEGKTDEGAEPEPILSDADHKDDASPAGEPAQAVTSNTAPVPSPVPTKAEAEASETIEANPESAALTRTAVPKDQPQAAQVKATDTDTAPETREGAATEAADEAAPATATSNVTAVSVAQGVASKATGTATSRADTTGPAIVTAPASNKAQATPDAKVQKAEKHRADAPTMEVGSADTAALSAFSAEQDSTSKLATTHDKAGTVDPSAMAMTAGAPAPAALQSAAPITPPVMAPTNALVLATPAEVVDILSDTLGSPEEKKNSVHIQLDPPELGRVSLEFKFDTHGLQHVTIVGETPEAMRQLRLMHFELVNALERQGLSSENMSFQQQQQTSQDQGQNSGRNAGAPQRNAASQTSGTVPELVVQNTIQSRPISSAGLNIKL